MNICQICINMNIEDECVESSVKKFSRKIVISANNNLHGAKNWQKV